MTSSFQRSLDERLVIVNGLLFIQAFLKGEDLVLRMCFGSVVILELAKASSPKYNNERCWVDLRPLQEKFDSLRD